ncbi:MAG: HAD family acid phosphatase [Opitutaceae bacterium]|nr:HAD family acid phosphatase [Opitutaceae bacterium]
MQPSLKLLLTAALALAFAGCTTVPPEPANLSEHKAELLRYADSGRYDTDIAAIAAKARAYVIHRAARRTPSERLALVLDIDDTALSNLPHMRTLDFGYVPSAWHSWLARGEAPAISPVLDVYRAAVAAGVSVFFVTSREESDRAGTESNLQKAGYKPYAGLVLLSAHNSGLTNAAFKTSARKRITEEGFTVIANIGDQESDLVGGYAQRSFKLPNPFYISE